MKIDIARRLRPFSHQPGFTCLLPLSSWQVRVFPTRVEMMPIGGREEEKFAVHLFFQGPMEGFTVELDLERGHLHVFGRTERGYVSYEIRRATKKIVFRLCKGPDDFAMACTGSVSFSKRLVGPKEEVPIVLTDAMSLPKPRAQRLCFGVHKAQEWEDIWRRVDLKEIFPFLLRLSDLLPPSPTFKTFTGTGALLQQCIEKVQSGEGDSLFVLCRQWIKTAFSGFLVPRWQDGDFQGILAEQEGALPEESPLSLLIYGGQFIRSLFFQERLAEWVFLPSLLSCFPSGRLTDVVAEGGERIAIEWSKHRLQKVVIHTTAPRKMHFCLPKDIASVRVRNSLKDRGSFISVIEGKMSMDFIEGKTILLDRFTKR